MSEMGAMSYTDKNQSLTRNEELVDSVMSKGTRAIDWLGALNKRDTVVVMCASFTVPASQTTILPFKTIP